MISRELGQSFNTLYTEHQASCEGSVGSLAWCLCSQSKLRRPAHFLSSFYRPVWGNVHFRAVSLTAAPYSLRECQEFQSIQGEDAKSLHKLENDHHCRSPCWSMLSSLVLQTGLLFLFLNIPSRSFQEAHQCQRPIWHFVTHGLCGPSNSPGQNTGVVAFPFSRGSS